MGARSPGSDKGGGLAGTGLGSSRAFADPSDSENDVSYLGFKALPDNGHWGTASRADRTCSSQHIKRKGKKYDVSVLDMPQLFLAMFLILFVLKNSGMSSYYYVSNCYGKHLGRDCKSNVRSERKKMSSGILSLWRKIFYQMF